MYGTIGMEDEKRRYEERSLARRNHGGGYKWMLRSGYSEPLFLRGSWRRKQMQQNISQFFCLILLNTGVTGAIQHADFQLRHMHVLKRHDEERKVGTKPTPKPRCSL